MKPITDPAVLDGYLTDASNTRGAAEMLFRPRSTEEVAEVVAWCQARAIPLTVTARRTSTTGAPVPQGGALLSTELLAGVHALDDVDGGVLLGAYQAEVERRGRFFPPDPTSRHECSVGGAVACNASGARTFKYGPTRPWVEAAEIVLPTGEARWVDRATPVPWPVPRWEEPAVKTAAGLFPADNLLDLFIGSEGTLGVATRVRTRLTVLPPHVLAFLAYFPTRAAMLGFLGRARAMGPRCIEYFDRHSLDLIRGRVPDVPAADSALFLEVEHDAEDPPLDAWFEALVEHDALVDDTIVATDDAGRAKLHVVRHALPAGVNEIIARNGVSKVGTDFAVPAAALPTMLEAYDATGMRTVCFGHIGDSHLHLNFLPKDAAELAEARARYAELARMAVSLGGTVSAEHGIGRLKKAHLALMVPPEVIEGWRALKRAADPNWILGRGVMFDPPTS
ncbi:MAG: FAD-binding oxidoreductase [Myxococcota bacterium]